MNEKTKLEIDLTKVPFNPLEVANKVDREAAKKTLAKIVEVLPPSSSILYLSRIMKLGRIGCRELLDWLDADLDTKHWKEGVIDSGNPEMEELYIEIMSAYRAAKAHFDGGFFSHIALNRYDMDREVSLTEFLAMIYRRIIHLAFALACSDD